MAKWKDLPTDPEVLKKLLQTLKDKEAKLEADLAIKDKPELESSITQVVLAMAEVRKIDTAIMKVQKPESLEERKAVEALYNQIAFYRNKLASAEESLKEKGGRAAEKYAELKHNREQAMIQLVKIFRFTKGKFSNQQIDLEKLIPSIADFVETQAKN